MTPRLSVTVGRYTVLCGEAGDMVALRDGEPWRDLTGDKLVLAFAEEVSDYHKLQDAKMRIGDSGMIGQAEAPKVSSGNPLDVSKETAVEHLKNAQQVAAGLRELLEGKGLTALAGDVRAVYDRIERAREEIGKGNIGR